jgi:hypothetical protein
MSSLLFFDLTIHPKRPFLLGATEEEDEDVFAFAFAWIFVDCFSEDVVVDADDTVDRDD